MESGSGNPYEITNRLRKVLRLLAVMNAGHMTGELASQMDETQWRIVLVCAQITEASPETRSLVVQALFDQEAISKRAIPSAWVRALLGDFDQHSDKEKGGDKPKKKRR